MQNTKDNPPCNTLFIGNLGEAVNENELRALFSGWAWLTVLFQFEFISILQVREIDFGCIKPKKSPHSILS